jgi:hypothetical protein
MCLCRGTKIVEQSFIMKAGIPSDPTDLEGPRRVIALKISDSDNEVAA